MTGPKLSFDIRPFLGESGELQDSGLANPLARMNILKLAETIKLNTPIFNSYQLVAHQIIQRIQT